MVKLDRNSKYYYMKIGAVGFISLLLLSILSLSFLFETEFLGYTTFGFYIHSLFLILSGPVSLVFVGSLPAKLYLPIIFSPVFLLLFAKKKTQFIVTIIVFSLYWFGTGTLIFMIYAIS